jgi:hypothetical protein
MRLGIVEQPVGSRVGTMLGTGTVQELGVSTGMLASLGNEPIKVCNASIFEIPKGAIVSFHEVGDYLVIMPRL